MVTLYISHDSGKLGKHGEALSFSYTRGKQNENIPIHLIDDVIILGRGSISTPALHLLMDKNIPVHFISGNGQYKGSITSAHGVRYAVRREQFNAASSPQHTLEIARNIVRSKIISQRKTLQRARNRHFQGDASLTRICNNLAIAATDAGRCETIEILRGIEGASASAYFSVFERLLLEPWFFKTRNRRPPQDPVNALLSFGYTLLLSRVVSAICIVGLDPCVGFLHTEYRGRPALALDLMEEFRSPVVDRMVIGALNQNFLKPEHFYKTETGACLIESDARKIFIREFIKRLDIKVTNENTKQNATFRNHIFMQSQALYTSLKNNAEYVPLSIETR